MNKILSLTRRCVEDYEMIRPGDRIAVGVSGGKDSLLLLVALAKLREFYPVPFTVEAITLDMGAADGLEGMDFSPIADLCKELESLPLKSAEEFDRYFQIGRSSYFFSRVRYLIRAKWERIRKNVKEEDPAQMEMARKAVCYLVMADVVMTFDVTEWPRAIRYDFNHEYSKGSSTQSRQNLAKTFLEEAKAAEAAIADLNAGTTGTGLQNFNKESNKHFTML